MTERNDVRPDGIMEEAKHKALQNPDQNIVVDLNDSEKFSVTYVSERNHFECSRKVKISK